MRIGIDATNIGGGGGLTHLKEVLGNFNHVGFKENIEGITVFGSNKVLSQLPDHPIISKITFPNLNKGLATRVYFQITQFDKEIEKRCDILFSVAGDYLGSFKPVIGMSRNMLLYERDIWKEIKQPKEIIRFWLNFQKQKRCFNNAAGIIFISKYAKKYASRILNLQSKSQTIIHHGISPRFLGKVKAQLPITDYNFKKPFKFLYVSTVHVYKHQWNVVNAISLLRKKGFPVELHLVGGVIFKPAGRKLFKSIAEKDPKKEFIYHHGNLPYDKIESQYNKADGLIFASTCENMPNILMESMASGVPIACSNKEPMPEFLGSGGYYFDAKSVLSIATTLEQLLLEPKERRALADRNMEEVKKYSWKKTSIETFNFIVNTYKKFDDDKD
jgi:glycosyltransferase involved in cell wall biosynthesis